eukprot:scaffold94543_cov19-Tisochrysis_lutea.AAC.2
MHGALQARTHAAGAGLEAGLTGVGASSTALCRWVCACVWKKRNAQKQQQVLFPVYHAQLVLLLSKRIGGQDNRLPRKQAHVLVVGRHL